MFSRSIIARFLRAITSHPVGFAGVLLVTSAAFLFLALFLLDGIGVVQGPYVGIVTYLVLPGVFLLGLLLIPFGRYLRSRAEQKGVVVDLSEEEQRRRLALFFLLTIANVAILSVAAYSGVHFTDSNTFCGEVCHQVMEPEYTVYQRSPHARVPCVSCHIGPGADFFVRYKINGISQVFAVLFDTYSRPIPTPVENLRPARETCEECHWPEKFHGDKLLVKSRFEEDERNTELKTVMVLKVGGGGAESGFASGIHWHTNPENRVTFVASDREQQDIVWVQVEKKNGETRTFTQNGEEVSDSLLAHGERRLMDCVDCHNRPTHIYEMPEAALDEALAMGRIDSRIPAAKRNGLELLTADYESKKEALASIPEAWAERYRQEYPDLFSEMEGAVREAGAGIGDIYRRNIFPTMNIGWGTYRSHLGHPDDEGGCFRCHAGEQEDESGRAIESSCDLCHTLLAIEEEDPDVLTSLTGE